MATRLTQEGQDNGRRNALTPFPYRARHTLAIRTAQSPIRQGVLSWLARSAANVTKKSKLPVEPGLDKGSFAPTVAHILKL